MGVEDAAFRIAKEMIAQKSKDYKKIVEYLERAIPYNPHTKDEECKSEKALKLLTAYLEAEKELPIGIRNEAELVMEQGGLLAAAEAFLQGEIFEKNSVAACYFLIKWQMCSSYPWEIDEDYGIYFKAVRSLLKDMEREGHIVLAEVYEEIDKIEKDNDIKECKEEAIYGWRTALIFVELNAKYHILDMDKYQEKFEKPIYRKQNV
ncbi:MAG: hypothetical protein J6A75_02610 [Lachnospiraceae bacterium]|nr:hypothetical protein [Lachnospiraceae bacterium]